MQIPILIERTEMAIGLEAADSLGRGSKNWLANGAAIRVKPGAFREMP
jgi:hypothetical protein